MDKAKMALDNLQLVNEARDKADKWEAIAGKLAEALEYIRYNGTCFPSAIEESVGWEADFEAWEKEKMLPALSEYNEAKDGE